MHNVSKNSVLLVVRLLDLPLDFVNIVIIKIIIIKINIATILLPYFYHHWKNCCEEQLLKFWESSILCVVDDWS